MIERPWLLILIGVAGMVVGVVLPFLMVIRIITPTLWLNILAFVCQIGGLFLGFIGLMNYVRPGGRDELG